MSLIDVGEHECVTCTKCAFTFAKVHEACPQCHLIGVVRKQGNFIQHLREELRDFTTSNEQKNMGGRKIADRGLISYADKSLSERYAAMEAEGLFEEGHALRL